MENGPDGTFETQWDKPDGMLLFCPFIYEQKIGRGKVLEPVDNNDILKIPCCFCGGICVSICEFDVAIVIQNRKSERKAVGIILQIPSEKL